MLEVKDYSRLTGKPELIPANRLKPLQSSKSPMYRGTSMTSQFRFTVFTLCYWRNPSGQRSPRMHL
jgi:hypothetical protein